MSEQIGVFYFILLVIGVCCLFAKKLRAALSRSPNGFAYLTVREQLAEAKATSDALGEAEQLITDMQESDEDDVMVLHIEWIGRDDEKHSLDLYCNGSNTVTECMTEIGEREAHDLQMLLARQCAILSDGGRRRQNSRQNDCHPGEGSAYEEIMSALRS